MFRKEVEIEVLHRIGDHKFDSNVPAFFLVSSFDTCDELWPSKYNGLIICSEQIDLDDVVFFTRALRIKLSTNNAKAELAECRTVWCFTWMIELRLGHIFWQRDDAGPSLK